METLLRTFLVYEGQSAFSVPLVSLDEHKHFAEDLTVVTSVYLVDNEDLGVFGVFMRPLAKGEEDSVL